MPQTLYCWRCRIEIPMLDEQEWQRVGALLGVDGIKAYQERQRVGLEQAKNEASWEALALYREITGFAETNANALWHHRIALFGPPCHVCGKPLRTPRAKLCAECGSARASRPSSRPA